MYSVFYGQLGVSTAIELNAGIAASSGKLNGDIFLKSKQN